MFERADPFALSFSFLMDTAPSTSIGLELDVVGTECHLGETSIPHELQVWATLVGWGWRTCRSSRVALRSRANDSSCGKPLYELVYICRAVLTAVSSRSDSPSL